MPLLAEHVSIAKRSVETSRVEVKIRALERSEAIDVPLRVEEVDVERREIGRIVEEPVPIRHEGETTIISIHEEVASVTKHLVLREELRIRRRTTLKPSATAVRVRREEAEVLRNPSLERDRTETPNPRIEGSNPGGTS